MIEWAEFNGQWGTQTITVASDGASELHFEPATSSYPPRQGRTVLSPAELNELRGLLAQQPWCAIQSQGIGRPGESRPSLTLYPSTGPCTLTLWKHEFPERVGPLMQVIERLRVRMQ